MSIYGNIKGFYAKNKIVVINLLSLTKIRILNMCMSNELVSALSGAIVGSIIAGFFGWLLPRISEQRALNNKKNLFSTALVDDLTTAPSLFEKIINDWEKIQQISFEYTIELKERRKIYQKNSDLILLYPPQLRAQISTYYIRTDKLISLVEILQNKLWSIFSEYQKTLKIIKISNPQLSEADANQLAITSLNSENKEAIATNTAIEKNIQQLHGFGKEAKEIIEKLKPFT